MRERDFFVRCIGAWRGPRARLKKKPLSLPSPLFGATCTGRTPKALRVSILFTRGFAVGSCALGRPRRRSARDHLMRCLDGNGGPGQIVATKGMDLAIRKAQGVHGRNSVGAQHQRFHDGFGLCDEGARSRFHRDGDEQRGPVGGGVGRSGAGVQYQPLGFCNTSRVQRGPSSSTER